MAQPETNRNIKILSVVWYNVLPAKFGGQKAVAFFNEHLGRKAPLVCLCSNNNLMTDGAYTIHATLPVKKTQFLDPFVWRKICLTAKKEKASHLLLEFPYHGIAGMICKRLLRTKLVLRAHNIECLRFREMGKWWWKLLFYFERWVMRNADALFFFTEADRKKALEEFNLHANRLEVLPYGVKNKPSISKEAAQRVIREKHGLGKDEKILLFAGTLDYRPNADAVLDIEKKLVPLLNHFHLSYKIIICGRNKRREFAQLKSLNNQQIIFAGEVDEIEIYFRSADVFINPVLSGGGVQTKMLDALSHHANVVCFASRLAGIAEGGDKVFSVNDNDWNEFARAIIDASQKNIETPAAFFEAHNWSTIAAQAYKKLITI